MGHVNRMGSRELDGRFVRKLAVNPPLGRTRNDGKILLYWS